MLRLFKQYYPVRNIFFVIGESLFIYIAFVAVGGVVLGTGALVIGRLLHIKILLATLICQTCLYYNDLYDLQKNGGLSHLAIRLTQALGVAVILIGCLYLIFPATSLPKEILVAGIPLIIFFIVSWRWLYTLILNRGWFNQKIIVLGSGRLAHNIMKEIERKRDCGYSVDVLIPEDPMDSDCGEHRPYLKICKPDYVGLCEIATELGIHKIIVALQEKRKGFPTRELLTCRINGIDILDGVSFFEMLSGKLTVEQTNPGWFIFSEGFRKSAPLRFFKRSGDLGLALLLLCISAPLIMLTALLIKIDSRGPILYSQERVGQHRKSYRIYKFRSMVSDAEKRSGPVWAQTDDDRVTRVGHFIRKWRIDELPQLWNVIRGDMSLVGPRPEREFFVKKLEEVIPYYAERFTVKPGVTGWAQVSYGYGASVEDAIEKLNYDLFYIKNLSIFMDMMIVLRTVKTVLFGTGAR